MNYGFLRVKAAELITLSVPQFQDERNIKHLYTTRLGGVSEGAFYSLNLRFNAGDADENVIRNFEIALNALNSTPEKTVCTKQVHEADVLLVDERFTGRGILKKHDYEADALITQERDLTLAGFYADCPVALFYDKRKQAIGVAHAGWRGTAKRILSKTIKTMEEKFSSDPEDIIVAIGPSIGSCCFETDRDVPDALISSYGACISSFVEKKQNKYHINLREINAVDLLQASVLPQHITLATDCTSCENELFWSHRKTNGNRGVQAALISLV